MPVPGPRPRLADPVPDTLSLAYLATVFTLHPDNWERFLQWTGEADGTGKPLEMSQDEALTIAEYLAAMMRLSKKVSAHVDMIIKRMKAGNN